MIKVFYDLRTDNDALHHLHQVHVRAYYDLQVLRQLKFQDSTDIYLHGLKRVLAGFLKESNCLTEEQVHKVDAVKEQGHELFTPENGGTQLWKERPLRPILVDYAAIDVQFLLHMKRLWTPNDPAEAAQLHQDVMKASEHRLKCFVALPQEDALNQSAKKLRDFYEASDTSRILHVPSHKKGALIGKKGANIEAIQAKSGAKAPLLQKSGT